VLSESHSLIGRWEPGETASACIGPAQFHTAWACDGCRLAHANPSEKPVFLPILYRMVPEGADGEKTR
jgi:hypothetical protein